MKVTAALSRAFSPQMMRAAVILRMSGRTLADFLRFHSNPYLTAADLPPPVGFAADADAPNIRQLLYARVRDENPDSTRYPFLSAVIESIGNDGFLDMPDEWAAADGMPDCIRLIRDIAPAGVGARDAQECILLQLRRLPASAARDGALRLVRDNFHYLSRKRFDKLPKRHLPAILRLLETVPPFPSVPAPAAAPTLADIHIRRRQNLWKADAGDGIGFSPAARRSSATDSAGSPAQWQEAKEIVAAVRNRRRWLLQVGQLAADRQSRFFEDGETALTPLPAQQVAQTLAVSAGFVSHILHDKTVIAPNGVFSLKYLFPRNAGAAVRGIIKQMIHSENRRAPLTDTVLCQRLRRRGIMLQRRTVGKYRQMAGIAPAPLRKQFLPSSPQEDSYAN